MKKALKSVVKYAGPIAVLCGLGWFLVHGGVSFSAGCNEEGCGVKSGFSVEIPNLFIPKIVTVPSI